MTKNERSILNPLASAIIRSAKHEWWDLKRQVFDLGYQSGYPAESLFDTKVMRSIELLSERDRELITQKELGSHPKDSKAKIARMIQAIILQRARVASARTENWQ